MHESTTRAIYAAHPKIKTVRYPGLKSDPNYELATSQMNGYGGIISIELDTDLNGTLKFLENIEIFTLAELKRFSACFLLSNYY